LTNLNWLKRATISPAPVDWQTALDKVAELNYKKIGGKSSWRLPNINELESLTDCSQSDPALPAAHLFVELQDTYWSSTTSYFETDWAWVYYLVKGALGVGFKSQPDSFVWPVS